MDENKKEVKKPEEKVEEEPKEDSQMKMTIIILYGLMNLMKVN